MRIKEQLVSDGPYIKPEYCAVGKTRLISLRLVSTRQVSRKNACINSVKMIFTDLTLRLKNAHINSAERIFRPFRKPRLT